MRSMKGVSGHLGQVESLSQDKQTYFYSCVPIHRCPWRQERGVRFLNTGYRKLLAPNGYWELLRYWYILLTNHVRLTLNPSGPWYNNYFFLFSLSQSKITFWNNRTIKVVVVSQLFLEVPKRPQITHHISSSFYRRHTLCVNTHIQVWKLLCVERGKNHNRKFTRKNS